MEFWVPLHNNLKDHVCWFNHGVVFPRIGNILVPCLFDQNVSRWQNQGAGDILCSLNVVASSCRWIQNCYSVLVQLPICVIHVTIGIRFILMACLGSKLNVIVLHHTFFGTDPLQTVIGEMPLN